MSIPSSCTVLVERRSSPSKRLRAKFFYPRTIELYRSLGIGPEIATPSGMLTDAAIVHSLVGEEIRRWTLPAIEGTAASPCVASSIKQ